MRHGKVVKLAKVSGFKGTATLVLLIFAMFLLATPNAQATPTIAKGKPCGTCHSGSPPSKANVKK